MYNVGKLYNTGERYNIIQQLWKPPAWYTHLAHALPIIVNAQLKPEVLLYAAYEIFTDEQLAGEDKLTFRLPHPMPSEMTVGVLVDLAGKIYRGTIISAREDEQGTRFIEVEAWALWYDLIKMPELPAQEWIGASISEILDWLLPGSRWTAHGITVTSRRNLRWGGGSNRLECLREMERVFNAEIKWDTVNRIISVASAVGPETGLFFLRGKNLRTAESEISFVDTVHRLYPRGHRGLTISTVNNGLPYLEVPSPYDPPPSAVLVAEEFTDPHQLKEYAEIVFATMNTPQVNYTCGIVDLSAMPGYEEETIRLGDVVTVFDEGAGINIKTRVVRMRYSVEEPWNSEIELATIRQDLSSTLENMQRDTARFEAADTISSQDIAQLMVFNHLLNSRADDGFAYWVNDGWEVDNTRGFSGPASFRAVGQPGISKTLLQTVWPAHRENYVISLRALLENVSVGALGRLGVEVVVHYTDGTSEIHFISLLGV